VDNDESDEGIVTESINTFTKLELEKDSVNSHEGKRERMEKIPDH
jgi:hypothetical protein